MSKVELGVKLTCSSCGARYYDLNKKPALCPKCGAENERPKVFRPKKAEPAAPKPTQEKPAEKKEKTGSADDIEDIEDIEDDDDDALIGDDDLDEDDDDVEGVIGPIDSGKDTTG